LATVTPAPIAPQPCIVPAGHADAATSGPAGSVSLQITFVQPCDLSVRVSAVNFTVRYGAFGDIASARIGSRTRLAAPVVIYDAAVDGRQTATFNKNLGASAPGALDKLHEAICAGEATLELIGVNGATLADAPVVPSNTGKC
jgi:hypothetical protein